MKIVLSISTQFAYIQIELQVWLIISITKWVAALIEDSLLYKYVLLNDVI